MPCVLWPVSWLHALTNCCPALYRELAYQVRVRILEAIDTDCALPTPTSTSSTRSSCCPGDELGKLLYRLGLPWASLREEGDKMLRRGSSSSSSSRDKGRLSKDDLDDSYREYLRIEGLGAIVR